MLERMKYYEVVHHKSRRQFSDLQRLTLFFNWQRRDILCAIAQIEGVCRRNPAQSDILQTAALNARRALTFLQEEYERDRSEILRHRLETTRAGSVVEGSAYESEDRENV